MNVSRQMSAIFRWIGVLVFFFLPSVLCAAEIFVLSDRNPVGVGEEFTLTFSTTEQLDSNPDFSPLNQYFDIVRTSADRSIQIINGVTTQEFIWRVSLYPRGVGTFPVPSIQFGKQRSRASQIVVNDSTANDGLSRDSVIVELEVDTPEPYVQQQFIVTQRMLHSVELQRGGASMSHPEVNEGKALVEQLGKVTNRTLNRKGIQYKVSERRYAVFAQTSGELTFRPTVFQGIVKEPGVQRRSIPFGMMSGRQIRRFSEPLTLNVKGQPASVKGTWLPAKSLSLNMYWETPPAQFKTGEPVTLTIAVIADGLMAEQLPEIRLALPKGIKGYSNQPELSNNDQGGSIVGTRQERWILIGTAPGEYTLPAFNVKWWNLVTGKAESTSVEAKKITVVGEISNPAEVNTVGVDDQKMTELNESTEEVVTPEQALMSEDKQEVVTELEKEKSHRLWWFVIGLLLLILLGVLYKRRANRALPDDRSVLAPKAMKVNYFERLERACQKNDAQAAYDSLLGWVREDHDLPLNPRTLTQFRQKVDMPFRQLIDELSMVLYARQAGEWRGSDLWKAVYGFHRDLHAVQGKVPGDLLKLYPD